MVFFGFFELKKAMDLRESVTGKVCSGDYLLPGDWEMDGIYTKNTEYFMTSEGDSITFMK